MYQLLVLLLLFSNSICTNFDISSTSVCTKTSTAGFCIRWEQNGTVQQDTKCFPSNTQLMTSKGLKAIQFITQEDQILAHESGKDVYTHITTWFHKSSMKAKYLQIILENTSLIISAKHLLANEKLQYYFAEQLYNRNLFNNIHLGSLKQDVVRQGIYAPKTQTNNYYVYTKEGHKILVHCYANIRNPEKYSWIVDNLIVLYDKIYGEPIQDEHPLPKWLQKNLSWLIQK